VRILYHHRTRGEDAQGIHVRELIRGFRALGHEVDLVALLARNGAESSSSASGEPSDSGRRLPDWLYELLLLAYNVPAFFVLLVRSFRFRPNMIYERYSLFAGAGLLVARLRGIPFLLEVNAPLSIEMKTHGSLRFESLARRMETWICRSATRTIVVTQAMASILEASGVPADRLSVMPNGVDRSRFHPGVDGSAVRARHGLEECFVVGFVGWIRPWHRVDLLLQSAARLGHIEALRIFVVGDGPAVPDLIALARELNVSDRVVFSGAVTQEEIPAHLAAMNVAVQPDVTEYASPIKLFEYLAMGRAVIAPRKANILEVVEDGSTALLYAPGEVSDLTDKIQRLHDDPDLVARLSRAADRLIEERQFHWLGNARKVVEMTRHS
jgi:glycosyltransferase involved in cell wall biosynthesis